MGEATKDTSYQAVVWYTRMYHTRYKVPCFLEKRRFQKRATRKSVAVYLPLELARPKVDLVGEPHLIRQLPQSFRHETLVTEDVAPASELQMMHTYS